MKYVIILIYLLLSIEVAHAKTVSEKQAERKAAQKSRQPVKATTTTRGYVGKQHVNLKTTNTASGKVTKGYVDGKYVKVKEKKR